MRDVAARPWLAAAWGHLALGALLGLVAAAPSGILPPAAHVFLLLAALFCAAGGLLHGYMGPFLKREPRTPVLSHAALGTLLLGDGVLLAEAALPEPARLGLALHGVAYLLLVLHALAAAAFGAPWRGGIALFAKDQPFRVGDTLAAAAFAVGLLGLAASGALHLLPPRGTPGAALTAHLLGFALPFFSGFVLFLAPRNAKTPLPGATLHAASLAILALSALALAVAFAYPVGASFRAPAAGALLAALLASTAYLRLRMPDKPGVQWLRARPLVRGALVLGLLAPLLLPFSFFGAGPDPAAETPDLRVLVADLYAFLALALVLALAATLLAAPILLNAVPRDGAWAKWAAGLAIAGLFVLAPSFQYARSPLPGAAVLAAAAGLALWGTWPLRAPRREC